MSGLAERLGYWSGMTLLTKTMPPAILTRLLAEMSIVSRLRPNKPIDGAHLFCALRKTLRARLRTLGRWLKDNPRVWLSWPTPGSGVETDITIDVAEKVSREFGFKLARESQFTLDAKWHAVRLDWSGRQAGRSGAIGA